MDTSLFAPEVKKNLQQHLEMYPSKQFSTSSRFNLCNYSGKTISDLKIFITRYHRIRTFQFGGSNSGKSVRMDELYSDKLSANCSNRLDK